MPRPGPWRRGIVALAAVASMAATLVAAAPSTARADESGGRLTLGAFAEVERDGGASLGADAAWRTAGGTRLRVGVQHSDLESDNLQSLSTTRVAAGVRHRFGDGPTASLDVAWWRDPDAVTVREAAAGVEFGPPELALGLRVGWRTSDFEPLPLAGTVQLPNGRPLAVSGTASCSLDDLSYGLELSRDTGDWYAYGGGRAYDYGDPDCRYSTPALDVLRRAPGAAFRQIAAARTARLSRAAVAPSDLQTSFLDWRVGAGLARRFGAHEVGVDVDHARERFDGFDATTLGAHWTRAFDSGLDVTVYAGAADAESFGTLPFLGLAVARTF